MFFSDSDGNRYPLTRIVAYTETYDVNSRRTFRVKLDGRHEIVDVIGSSIDAIERAGSTTVPAEPGTLYLGRLSEDNEVWVEPVIAWIVTLHGQPLPVTAGGPEAGVSNQYAVIHPSGKVTAFEETHVDLEAFLEDKGYSNQEIGRALSVAAKARQTP